MYLFFISKWTMRLVENLPDAVYSKSLQNRSLYLEHRNIFEGATNMLRDAFARNWISVTKLYQLANKTSPRLEWYFVILNCPGTTVRHYAIKMWCVLLCVLWAAKVHDRKENLSSYIDNSKKETVWLHLNITLHCHCVY